MDAANFREALREIDLDIEEGADMILMKPAMPFLDIVRAARDRVGVPIGAYQVSGEYAMLHAAFQEAGSSRTAPCWSRSSASAAPARISSSPTSPRTPPNCSEAAKANPVAHRCPNHVARGRNYGASTSFQTGPE